MKEGNKLDKNYIQRNKANFYKFFIEHDRRRGTNFGLTFPEMRDFYLECSYYAKSAT